MDKNFRMIAKTLFGFEPLLADELRKLGAMKVVEGIRNVSFEGDTGFMYKANIALRTAIRILVPIASFKILDEQDLYKKMRSIKWEEHMDVKSTFAINSTTHSDNFTHSHYVSLKCKDAIADYFRDKFGERPNVELDNPTLMINIHIQQDHCDVSLDSSGDALSDFYEIRSVDSNTEKSFSIYCISSDGWPDAPPRIIIVAQ